MCAKHYASHTGARQLLIQPPQMAADKLRLLCNVGGRCWTNKGGAVTDTRVFTGSDVL